MNEGCICKDCGVDTIPPNAPHEFYMVRDELWLAAGMHTGLDRESNEEFLCIGCLEKRLGRELAGADFTDTPVNSASAHKSPRMRDRLDRGLTLDQKIERADRVVEWALDVREDAIRNLVDAEMAYSEALEAWGDLQDKAADEHHSAGTQPGTWSPAL